MMDVICRLELFIIVYGWRQNKLLYCQWADILMCIWIYAGDPSRSICLLASITIILYEQKTVKEMKMHEYTFPRTGRFDTVAVTLSLHVGFVLVHCLLSFTICSRTSGGLNLLSKTPFT